MEAEQKHALFIQAKEWTMEAGERIKERVQQPFKVNTKRDRKDLVTEVDEDTEKFFAEKIRKTYPDHQVLGEEGFGDDVKSLDGVVWIIDPIDGTMNFVHQKRNFAISVAIYQDGVGIIGLIYNVMTGDLYSAKKGEGAYKNKDLLPKLDHTRKLEDCLIGINQFWAVPNRRLDETGVHQLIRTVRGTRSYGSAALEFAYVAEGIMDGYITMRLAPWDIAAGVVIVQEVGGMATRADGKPLDMLRENTVITCNPAVHKEIIDHYLYLKD
ncbi:inositol monophosphatase [Virgibacillus sp. MSP4-1]|uniref:inositol monophosphatase family protein n=1 Tax=Virgibacillus sp. MSP4-1 TaxID=2700081 RepID=UPI0003A6FCC4|nr:inositol monophosphatase [Virgibacillus sp. MSP4-1]QHS22117.1 inositol monophosphatase [Virgibacillus sp. MSP4-1]